MATVPQVVGERLVNGKWETIQDFDVTPWYEETLQDQEAPASGALTPLLTATSARVGFPEGVINPLFPKRGCPQDISWEVAFTETQGNEQFRAWHAARHEPESLEALRNAPEVLYLGNKDEVMSWFTYQEYLDAQPRLSELLQPNTTPLPFLQWLDWRASGFDPRFSLAPDPVKYPVSEVPPASEEEPESDSEDAQEADEEDEHGGTTATEIDEIRAEVFLTLGADDSG